MYLVRYINGGLQKVEQKAEGDYTPAWGDSSLKWLVTDTK